MNYLKISFSTPTAFDQNILIGHLSTFDFNGFEQEAHQLIAYISETDYSDAVRACVQQLSSQYNLKTQQDILVDQNWNAQWESDYEPVMVDTFCAVRAAFHAPISSVKHEIVVTPKMSFGTGHHATTYMMMKQMEALNIQGKKVLDYGSGTGVLAILAYKLGADFIQAVDIEHWAYENMLENFAINQVDNIDSYCGVLQDVPSLPVDVLLANINRNVLLNTMASMSERLSIGSFLLCSGILEKDVDLIVESAQQEGLEVVRKMQREKWRCILFCKR